MGDFCIQIAKIRAKGPTFPRHISVTVSNRGVAVAVAVAVATIKKTGPQSLKIMFQRPRQRTLYRIASGYYGRDSTMFLTGKKR